MRKGYTAIINCRTNQKIFWLHKGKSDWSLKKIFFGTSYILIKAVDNFNVGVYSCFSEYQDRLIGSSQLFYSELGKSLIIIEC